MGVRINHNTASLLIRSNLDRVSESINRSYTRISSGERINRAADDAAGLAISQGLRNEVRGLRQNVKNINDGVSVTSTMEAALASVGSHLERLRELALTSGNATMSDRDRSLTNTEFKQLVEEVQRLAQSTEFNGIRLLDGSYVNARVQMGVSSGEYLSISVPAVTTDRLGAIATVSGVSTVSSTAIVGTGDLVIAGVDIPATVEDGVSTASAAASALAKAKAINSVTGQTGVTATAGAAVYSVAGASIGAVNLDGATSWLTINGVNLGQIVVSAGDSTSNLRQRINMISDLTGVTASLGTGGELVLTAADGRNIRVETGGGVGATLGLMTGVGDVATTQSGTITLTAGETISVGGDLGLIGFNASQTSTGVDAGRSLANANVSTFSDAQSAIETIDVAMNTILRLRANIGAVQNRFEETLDSLMTTIEDLTASDSRIRDTDFAVETARLAQQQILQEASVAILAQANALPRSVLETLLG